jgi:hypothetical protein
VADDSMSSLEGGIPLSKMIQQLRRELQESNAAAEKENLRFKVEGVELELKVAVSRESSGDAGIRFWVVNLGVKHKAAEQDVHTFKLKLTPQVGPEKKEALVRGTSVVATE